MGNAPSGAAYGAAMNGERMKIGTNLCLATLGMVGLLALPGSAAALDASRWDAVLQAHAHRGGMDYAALRADAEAMANLDGFLASAATMSESEDLATWLNVYNAIVVKQVLQHYPLESVRRVSGFFDGTRYRVAGAQRTLDQIENQIIRPRFHDARVHFALNCGATSCPRLHARAFRSGNLDATLDRLARNAVRSRTHVRRGDDGVALSKIFEWFAEDFVRDGGSVLGWIRQVGGEPLADLADGTSVTYRRYNWRLNDHPRQ